MWLPGRPPACLYVATWLAMLWRVGTAAATPPGASGCTAMLRSACLRRAVCPVSRPLSHRPAAVSPRPPGSGPDSQPQNPASEFPEECEFITCLLPPRVSSPLRHGSACGSLASPFPEAAGPALLHLTELICSCDSHTRGSYWPGSLTHSSRLVYMCLCLSMENTI